MPIETTVRKFPSIEQFRHAIRKVVDRAHFVRLDDDGAPMFDRTRPLPKLQARGTVKIHGSNAGVRVGDDGELECWSRTRRISVDADNMGFARFVGEREGAFRRLLGSADNMLYGEWCGKGILKGCAVHELDKMFVIFAISSTLNGDRIWLDLRDFAELEAPADRIYNVMRFGEWALDIDFDHPAESQNRLVAMTEAVEAECPLGKHFGVQGVGEGIVWRLSDDSLTYNSSDFWFKVKGEKHSVTKTKQLAEVDVEALASLRTFAEVTVTQLRCEQGVQALLDEGKPVEQESTGTFLRWMFNDIVKEESDRMEASGLTKKDIGAAISKQARTWWFEHINTSAGL